MMRMENVPQGYRILWIFLLTIQQNYG